MFCLSFYHLVPYHFYLIFPWTRKSILHQQYVISCEAAAVGEWTTVYICGYSIVSRCSIKLSNYWIF